MNDKPEVQGGGLDTVKFLGAIILIVGGIFAYYWFQAQNELVRGGYVVLGLVLGGALAYQTRLGGATWGFIASSRNEVRKVVWPTREETIQTTLAVIVVVLIVGVMMWLLDIFLFWALRGLTGQGG
ncbi:MAG TPA: preprotein translocase subunit SecE [Gammaproteobacteria bacterium]|jgi:preprotein translocase subunit SecE|nr:preprotein translocase subunit SecE [Gammaproteobacteria bacterium]